MVPDEVPDARRDVSLGELAVTRGCHARYVAEPHSWRLFREARPLGFEWFISFRLFCSLERVEFEGATRRHGLGAFPRIYGNSCRDRLSWGILYCTTLRFGV